MVNYKYSYLHAEQKQRENIVSQIKKWCGEKKNQQENGVLNFNNPKIVESERKENSLT